MPIDPWPLPLLLPFSEDAEPVEEEDPARIPSIGGGNFFLSSLPFPGRVGKVTSGTQYSGTA